MKPREVTYRLLLFVIAALIFSSCGKHNYTNDDIYRTENKTNTHKTNTAKNNKATKPSLDDNGWHTLDIKLGKDDNKELYREIKEWLGTPYIYARADKGIGTDCSGFVMQVYKQVYNKAIERNSAKQFTKSCKPISRDALREGDLVFFHGKSGGPITHVGIYLKDGYFAHASSKGVAISQLSQRYYDTHFECAGRVK